MDYPSLKAEFDLQDYYTDLIEFPSHVEKALEQMKSFKGSFNPKSVLVCGMGGSGIPGYLLQTYGHQLMSVFVGVENGYQLPSWVNEDTLVFIISYSGNTEEVLSCLKQSLDKGLKVVLISSGGLVEQASVKYSLPFIKAPASMQPRAATPYLFTYVLEVLRQNGLLEIDYAEALSELRKLDLTIGTDNHAKEIAEQLMDKYVYIYTPRHLEAIGRRFQAQDFNENAKTLAKFSVLPEANHNETTAFGECQDLPLASIFLWDEDMSSSLKKRFLFTKQVCAAKGVVISIEARGKSLLSKMFSLIYQGDLISYYLSLLRHKNPLPVPLVEKLKVVLKNETSFKDELIKELNLV